MPRQSSKRKADGPVPTTTAREAPSNKLRKTMAALARDVSEERRGEEGLGAGEKRKRCVIEDDNEVDDDGEEANGDDDEEESETQQLLKIVKFGSREKREAAREASEYLKGFMERAGERERVVEKMLEERRDEAEKKDTEFLNSIKTAYELSNPFALHGTDKDLGSIAALFQRNKEILDSARSLVQKFEDVAQRIKSQDTTSLTANNWKEEDEALASLLEAGRKVGVDKCQSLMTASTERRLSAEEARAAKILYNRGQPGASGWGKVARKQEKAVRKLAKASEVDHDD